MLLSKTIKHLQANLIMNILLLILLFITGISVVYLTVSTKNRDVASQAIIEKRFNTLSEGIKELKELTTEEISLITEYNNLIAKHYASLEEDSIKIQEYITTNYYKVPVEVASIIASTTVKLCREYNISLYLVVGLMEVESSFNPYAVSNVGACGLLQVRPSVWGKELGIRPRSDLHDIETGIESGIKVLIIYLDRSDNDLTEALQRYNGIINGSKFSDKVYASMKRFDTFLNTPR